MLTKEQVEGIAGFTPGPWRIRVNSRDSQEVCDLSICGDIFVLADFNGPQYEHQWPNAKLAASAPDLHSTCLALFAEVERLQRDIHRKDAALAACAGHGTDSTTKMQIARRALQPVDSAGETP